MPCFATQDILHRAVSPQWRVRRVKGVRVAQHGPQAQAWPQAGDHQQQVVETPRAQHLPPAVQQRRGDDI